MQTWFAIRNACSFFMTPMVWATAVRESKGGGRRSSKRKAGALSQNYTRTQTRTHTHAQSYTHTHSHTHTQHVWFVLAEGNNFQRFGNEVLYNGFSGRKMQAQVFFGPTYYQRLKHMVDDKIHARARGPLQILTRQPVEVRRCVSSPSHTHLYLCCVVCAMQKLDALLNLCPLCVHVSLCPCLFLFLFVCLQSVTKLGSFTRWWAALWRNGA